MLQRILGGEGAEVARDVWEQADEVVASRLADAEARVGLGSLRRAGQLDAAAHDRATERLEGLIGGLRLVEVDDAVARASGAIAERDAVGASDAIHIATALAIDAPRVVVTTWRRGLADVAGEHGMPVVPRHQLRAAA